MPDWTPASLAAYLLRPPTVAMKEAIEAYEQGFMTLEELKEKLALYLKREEERAQP